MTMPYSLVVTCRDFGAVVTIHSSLVVAGLDPVLTNCVRLEQGLFRFTFQCVAEDGTEVETALGQGSGPDPGGDSSCTSGDSSACNSQVSTKRA